MGQGPAVRGQASARATARDGDGDGERERGAARGGRVDWTGITGRAPMMKKSEPREAQLVVPRHLAVQTSEDLLEDVVLVPPRVCARTADGWHERGDGFGGFGGVGGVGGSGRGWRQRPRRGSTASSPSSSSDAKRASAPRRPFVCKPARRQLLSPSRSLPCWSRSAATGPPNPTKTAGAIGLPSREPGRCGSGALILVAGSLRATNAAGAGSSELSREQAVDGPTVRWPPRLWRSGVATRRICVQTTHASIFSRPSQLRAYPPAPPHFCKYGLRRICTGRRRGSRRCRSGSEG